MGAECVRSSPRPKTLSSYSSEISRFSPQKGRTTTPYEFQFKVDNLCLASNFDFIYEVVFEIPGKMKIFFPHEDITIEGKLFVWKTSHRQKVLVTFDEVRQLPLTIKVYSRQKQKIDTLSLKLDQLFRGPIHHDHLIRGMNSRLIFDIQISQSVELRVTCCGLSLSDAQGKILKNEKFYYSLYLLFNRSTPHPEQDTISELQQSTKIKDVVLKNELEESSLKLVVWQKQNQEKLQVSNFAELKIPYQKIMSKCSYSKQQKKGDIQFQKRSILWEEQLNRFGSKKGTAKFQIILQTQQIYVEQLECLISSQKGIGAISPQFLKGLGNTSSSIFKSSNILLNFKQLKSLVKKYRNQRASRSVGDYHSRQLLKETYSKLTKGLSPFEDDDDDISLEESQEILLDLLVEVGKLIVEGEDVINENVWQVFQTIFRRSEISIRCIHAIENPLAQKRIGVKFYRFITSTLEKIVRSTAVWITYHELKYTQKFVAYAFFRFPWLQKEFIKAIKRSDDPVINMNKLTDMGVFEFSKSPSKTLVFDWDYALFSNIKNDPEYREAFEQLEETVESLPEWSKLLFNRDEEDFYYGFLIEILNQAELSLGYQGKIMWEYFPYYGDIIGSFLGQMNKSESIDYSQLFTQFSVKLMLNERLLNIFMLYLFPKTCLFETTCVMKCLDLIKSCFDVVVSKKNCLPTDFNADYFYSGIISILEFNHSYLSIRALWILYIYYDVFSQDIKTSLDSYLLGKIFYSLFLHWCGHVRKLFVCLLQSKIIPKLKNTESDPNISEAFHEKGRKYKRLLSKLQEKQKEIKKEPQSKIYQTYHQEMKAKMEQRKKKKFEKSQYIQKKPERKTIKRSFLQVDDNENTVYTVSSKPLADSRNRKWSVNCDTAIELEIPETSKKYIVKAMEEYREVKNSSSIDGEVEEIMKLFQKKKVDS